MTLAQRWCNVVHLMPTVSQLSDHISTIFQCWANVVMLSWVMLRYFYCMPLKYIYIHMIFWPLQFCSSVNETNVFMYVVTVWFVFLWLQTLYNVLCWIKLFVLYCIVYTTTTTTTTNNNNNNRSNGRFSSTCAEHLDPDTGTLTNCCNISNWHFVYICNYFIDWSITLIGCLVY